MSERSIAEIIGHRKVRSIDLQPGDVVEDFDGDRRTIVVRESSRQGLPGWKTASGWFSDQWFERHAIHVVPEPTVDDMLAWLRAKYGRLSMTAWALDAERPFVVAIECGPSGAPHIEQSGPTLHAALEAVVRVVAGSS